MPVEVLNALEASSKISSAYRNYLTSTFKPRRSDLAREFSDAVKREQLTKGPYLEASALSSLAAR